MAGDNFRQAIWEEKVCDARARVCQELLAMGALGAPKEGLCSDNLNTPSHSYPSLTPWADQETVLGAG